MKKNENENARRCVIFLTMSPRGILQLEATQMAVALRIAVQKANLGADSYLATLNVNADSPAGRLARSVYDDDHILCGENMARLTEKIKCLFGRYDVVLLEFAGSIHTLRHLILLKRKYGERFRIVASIWSYRHGTWLQWACSFIYAFLYLRYVDRVVFGCPYAARNFTMADLLFRKGKACVMPLAGTSCDDGDDASVWKILDARGLADVLKDNGVFKVVYMAQLRPIKNHIWLTKALIPVMIENPSLHVIYCGGEGGVRFNQIISLARAAKLEDRFHLPGRMPYETVPTIIRQANCSIVPSASETYGFTYIEPMMFGAPVLGTRVGVGEYAIQDYYNGLSFSLSSVEDFRQKIRFLVKNRELAAEMGRNARKFATETFSMPCVAEMRVAMYKDILG